MLALLLPLAACALDRRSGPDGGGFRVVADDLLVAAADGALAKSRASRRQRLVVPAGVTRALFADGATAAADLRRQRRFDLRVSGLEARTFFASLVDDDPHLNMIVHPEVRGAITLEVKSVTIDEVMDAVCEMYRFDCRSFSERGSRAMRGYKVFPWRLLTRTYRVDSLPVVRKGHSETVIADSGGTGSSIKTRYDADYWEDLERTLRSLLSLDMAVSSVRERIRIDARGDIETNIEKKRGIVQNEPEEGVKTTTTVSTEFDEDDHEGEVTVEKIEKGKAGKMDDGPKMVINPLRNGKSVVINRQAGLITVRADPRDHREISAFLEQLRERGQRQVILEGKILEVELDNAYRFGIDWLAINKGLGSSRFPPLSGEPNGGETFVAGQGQQRIVGGEVLNLNPLFSQGLRLTRAVAGGPFNLAFREHDFVGFIDLLEAQGRVRVLSSPRIATLNNQKAVIKVGSDELFITGLDSGSVSGRGDASRSTDPTAVFTSMFTGISLDVTPQIGEGGMVTLHVHPLVTEVQDKEKRFTINDRSQSLPLALSKTRETDSIVRVQDGDVAVIGGLMKREALERTAGPPLLGDLPGLGWMFGHVEKKWKKSELVILIRPVVVDRGWSRTLMRTAHRIGAMGEGPVGAMN